MKKKRLRGIFILLCLLMVVVMNPIRTKAVSKSLLIKAVLSRTNKSIIDACYADYDGNGERELFAVVGNSDDDDGKEIWFASFKETKRLHNGLNGGGMIYKCDGKAGTVCSVSKKQKIFIAECGAHGSGSWSRCWYVKSGKAYSVQLYNCGGLSQISGKDFSIVHDEFDAYDGAGHTYKPYYIKWTGKKFVEYKAKKITLKKLRKYTGADVVLDQLTEDGFQIISVYHRSNGLIHINVRKKLQYGICYDNVTLKIKEDKVKVMKSNYNPNYYLYGKTGGNVAESSYGGTYKASGFRK